MPSSTTDGSGGTTTTVTSLAALTSAVAGSAKKIVVISGMARALIYSCRPLNTLLIGTITGNAVVQVGPNTSVVGKSGASQYTFLSPPKSCKLTLNQSKLSTVLVSAR